MDLTALILITIPAMLFGAYLRDVAANRGRDEEIYKKKCPECGGKIIIKVKEGLDAEIQEEASCN